MKFLIQFSSIELELITNFLMSKMFWPPKSGRFPKRLPLWLIRVLEISSILVLVLWIKKRIDGDVMPTSFSILAVGIGVIGFFSSMLLLLWEEPKYQHVASKYGVPILVDIEEDGIEYKKIKYNYQDVIYEIYIREFVFLVVSNDCIVLRLDNVQQTYLEEKISKYPSIRKVMIPYDKWFNFYEYTDGKGYNWKRSDC